MKKKLKQIKSTIVDEFSKKGYVEDSIKRIIREFERGNGIARRRGDGRKPVKLNKKTLSRIKKNV